MGRIYDRQNKCYIVERDQQGILLKFLYKTVIGRVILKTIVARPYFSKLVGLYNKSELSYDKILPFVEKYNINTEDFDLSKMKSFNDFFTRTKKITLSDTDKNHLLAIADAKLSVFDISKSLKLNIKGNNYSVKELVGDRELAKEFMGGKCLVYRLTLDDYHRYHFLDSGFIKDYYKIKGELHTVRPISKEYKVFSRNTREVTVMETDNFGDVVQIEVGATLVGHIVNKNDGITFNRMDEKGYFEFGGSTIILLMKNNIKLDREIEICSKRNLEVKVRIGEKIGEKIN